MCECNLAFLYILNAAVGLSLCVSLQKKSSHNYLTYLYCITRERMNEIDCYCYYYPVRLIELLWKTIKGPLTGFTFYVGTEYQQWHVKRIHWIICFDSTSETPRATNNCTLQESLWSSMGFVPLLLLYRLVNTAMTTLSNSLCTLRGWKQGQRNVNVVLHSLPTFGTFLAQRNILIQICIRKK